MTLSPKEPAGLYDLLMAEKKRLETQLIGLDLARSEIEKIRHLRADEQVKKWLSSGLRAPN
jgi:hypothetical protein